MTTPGMPGMSPSEFWIWRMRWYGPMRGFEPGSITNLAERVRVLTNLVPRSGLQHLTNFQQSRLVLMVEKLGEYGATGAQRALRPAERRAIVNISRSVNQMIASARAAAAESAVEQAALSRAARAQMRWVERVNLRRAGVRGIFGTLGVGGTVVVGELLAILAVGLIANARQTSVLERIRAQNAGGGDPQVIVYGTPPLTECVQNAAAARGLIWTRPEGECGPTETGNCSWRAPTAMPEPISSDPVLPGETFESMRAKWLEKFAAFAAPRLGAARNECPAGESVVDVSGRWTLSWTWTGTHVHFDGSVTGSGSQWSYQGSYASGGNGLWTPGSGSIQCGLTGDPLATDATGRMDCTASFPDGGTWTGTIDGTFSASGDEVKRFKYRGSGTGTSPTDQNAAISALLLYPRSS